MYESYWGLTESPFQEAAGRRWFHNSPLHDEALSRLLYLVDERRRCGLLSGPAGTGKTLLLDLLARHARTPGRSASVFDLAGCQGPELLARVHAAATGLVFQRTLAEGSPSRYWLQLEQALQTLPLLGGSQVWLFDTFEQAGPETLSTLERLLALCGRGRYPITVVVATRLKRLPAMADRLADRIELRAELGSLNASQTATFIEDLCRQAGATRRLFADDALQAIHELADGIPRRIQRLCDLSLLAGFGEDCESVTGEIVRQAAWELRPERENGEPLVVLR